MINPAESSSMMESSSTSGNNAQSPGLKTHFKTPEGRYKLQYEKTYPTGFTQYGEDLCSDTRRNNGAISRDSVRRNIPFSPTPIGVISRGKSSILQNTMSEIEEVAISRTLTPTEVFNPRIKRTLSQPEIPIALPIPHSSHGSFNSSTKRIEHPLHRSHSVPNLKEAESTIHMVGRLNCVIRSVGALATSAAAPSFGKDVSNNLGKDVTEDAVCRICLVELGEGSAIVKMECSCKGELALAHRECAVKWFTLKGNRTCDICRNKVQNIHIKYNYRNAVINVLAQTGLALHRYWITVPMDVICSVTAYFLFVLELLSTKGDRDPPLAAPGSIVLGLIAHVISFRMARKQAWVYGLVQFGFVVLFGHVLYLVLNFGEYTSVLVAVLCGFSLTMVGHMVLLPMARSNQPSQVAMHPNPSSETIPASQQTDLESGNPRVDNSSN